MDLRQSLVTIGRVERRCEVNGTTYNERNGEKGPISLITLSKLASAKYSEVAPAQIKSILVEELIH